MQNLLKINKFKTSFLALSLLTLGVAVSFSAENLDYVEKTERGWLFAPAVNGGFNKLLEGYDGYEDLGNVGADLYVRAPTFNPFGRANNVVQRFYLRLSFDYMPLQPPKELLGLEEEMRVYSLHVLYQFRKDSEFGKQPLINPFIGLGYGFYQDVLELNTPASGSVKGTVEHSGYIFSAGLMLPVFKVGIPLRLIPEIRYHRVNIPGGQSTNMTYQASLAWWPGGPKK